MRAELGRSVSTITVPARRTRRRLPLRAASLSLALLFLDPSSSAAEVVAFAVPAECGDAVSFHERVLALGGDEPALAAARVTVSLEETGTAYRVDVRVEHEDDSLERTLEDEDCADLVEASAVIVVLALRELAPAVASSTSAPVTQAAAEGVVLTIVSSPGRSDRERSRAADDVPREPPEAPLPSTRLELDVSVDFGVGVLDQPTWGASATARLVIEWLELELGATLWPSRFVESPAGPPAGARIWIFDGSMAAGPALRFDWLTLASVLELHLGAISASGTGLDRVERVLDLHASLGLRVAARFALLQAFGLFVEIAGGLMLYRPAFEIDAVGPVFETPPGFFRAGAGIFARP